MMLVKALVGKWRGSSRERESKGRSGIDNVGLEWQG